MFQSSHFESDWKVRREGRPCRKKQPLPYRSKRSQTSRLAHQKHKTYFTDDKFIETFKVCETAGINTAILRVDDHTLRLDFAKPNPVFLPMSLGLQYQFLIWRL